jgi:hypothetical protein
MVEYFAYNENVSGSNPLSLKLKRIAQRQSIGLLIQGFWVQIPIRLFFSFINTNQTSPLFNRGLV